MASGAGLNRIGQRGGVPFYPAPLSGNGPFDSGIQMLEGIGFTKWNFQLLGTFTGYSVTVYATIDPAIYTFLYNQNQQGQGSNLDVLRGNTTLLPATSWVQVEAPSQQSGTNILNPLTAAGQYLPVSAPFVAFRTVVTGTASTGSIQVVGFAVP